MRLLGEVIPSPFLHQQYKSMKAKFPISIFRERLQKKLDNLIATY
jgi:hypothetical protein